MAMINSFKYIIMYITALHMAKIKGMHIPLTTKEQSGRNENVVGYVNENNSEKNVSKFSVDTINQNTVGVDHVQANGVELIEPTSRDKAIAKTSVGRYKEPWEINYNLCPPSLCTQNEEERPRGTSGSVFYNGDIVLDKESEKIIYGNTTHLRYKRATTPITRTWRNAIVTYIFASDIAPFSASVLSEAMRIIEKETCIRFRRRKFRDEDYIRFISEPGCWSAVGRVGGEQKISMGPGCERIGIAIHEIVHALGCWHEQARPDRDEYVEIIEQNIAPKYISDFKKANEMLVTSRGFPYDYESIMHYGSKAFTNLGEDTIKVIGIGRRLHMTIGQRNALSNIDIAQLRDVYQCFKKEDKFNTYCPKHWVKIGGKCYKFEDKQIETFSVAMKKCEEINSTLLFIDDDTEDFYIKRYIKKRYPNVKVWHMAERIVNGTVFASDTGKSEDEMKVTNWNKSHPATYSSLALVYNKRMRRVRWEGVWLDSCHAYAFICERKARRKCIPGKFPDGRDYRGTLDHTKDGYTCQKWSSQYPWTHKLLLFPYDGTGNVHDGLGDHNFCRNPAGDRKSRPWCYTTKSKYKWQYCDVSICSKHQGSASYRKKHRNLNANRSFNKTNSANPKRLTNEAISGIRNRVHQRQQTNGEVIGSLIRKRNSSNMKTHKIPVNRKFSNGKRGSSNRRRNINRKKKYRIASKRISNRKNGRSSSRRTSKWKKNNRRRKYHVTRQNKISNNLRNVN